MTHHVAHAAQSPADGFAGLGAIVIVLLLVYLRFRWRRWLMRRAFPTMTRQQATAATLLAGSFTRSRGEPCE